MRNLTRILLLIAVFPVCGLTAQDQTNFRVSLDLGINISHDKTFPWRYNDGSALRAPAIGFNFFYRFDGVHWLTSGVNYYQNGDFYHYYTGYGSQITRTMIFVHTLKIPLMYSLNIGLGKRTELIAEAGPSMDLVLGESKILPDDPLYAPDRFRKNIPQGEVLNRRFMLLNVAAGIGFKNKADETAGYLKFSYHGNVAGLYDESPGEVSTYENFTLKAGIYLFK